MARPKMQMPLGNRRHFGRGWSLAMRSFGAGQGAVSPRSPVLLSHRPLGICCWAVGSKDRSALHLRAFLSCAFSAALARAGWMLVHHPLPWWHSQIPPDAGPFCHLGQMELSLEQGWEVSTHCRRQISSDRLLLRSGPQRGACGCGHLPPGVVEPTRVQEKTSLLS